MMWETQETPPINYKTLQTTLGESDQLMVPKKHGNACREKGLGEEPLGQGYIFHTQMWVKDINKTGLITYLENDREVFLKIRKREKR